MSPGRTKLPFEVVLILKFNIMKSTMVTLKFKTDFGTDWIITRQFNDERHVDNFISLLERKKGYLLDEIFTNDKTL